MKHFKVAMEPTWVENLIMPHTYPGLTCGIIKLGRKNIRWSVGTVACLTSSSVMKKQSFISFPPAWTTSPSPSSIPTSLWWVDGKSQRICIQWTTCLSFHATHSVWQNIRKSSFVQNSHALAFMVTKGAPFQCLDVQCD